MRALRAFVIRLAGLFAGSRRDRDLAEELASHLQLHVDDSIRSGMTPEAARRDALLRLGVVEATKEPYRDQRGLPFPAPDRLVMIFATNTKSGDTLPASIR